jgi:ABC-2 type transport system permease protein
MTAIVFARKELHEILRTWRIWVLPGIVLFFAITGPLVARFTPELVGAVVGNSLFGL